MKQVKERCCLGWQDIFISHALWPARRLCSSLQLPSFHLFRSLFLHFKMRGPGSDGI